MLWSDLGVAGPAGQAMASITPTRSTSEQDLDRWNQALRQSSIYQNFMRQMGLPTNGRVTLTEQQQKLLEQAIRNAGITIPSGMKIDNGGNLNQVNRLGRNVAIGAGVTGAALTGLGAAGIGPLSGLAGGTAATGGATGLGGASGSFGAGAGTAAGSTAAGVGTTGANLGLTGALGAMPVTSLTGTAAPLVPLTAATGATGVGALAAGAGGVVPNIGAVGGGIGGGLGGAVAGGAGGSLLNTILRYAIPSVGSIVNGYLGNRAATNAAETQARASQQAIDTTNRLVDATTARQGQLYDAARGSIANAYNQAAGTQAQIYNQNAANYSPYLQLGAGSLGNLSAMTGGGPIAVPTSFYSPVTAPVFSAAMVPTTTGIAAPPTQNAPTAPASTTTPVETLPAPTPPQQQESPQLAAQTASASSYRPGSLASLANGDAVVTVKAPTGETRQMPLSQAREYVAHGAQIVS